MGYVISEDCIPWIPKREFCHGSRYNFKKGVEYCPHAKECPHAKNLIENKKTYDYEKVIFFYSVKDFRKCKKYLDFYVTD